MGLEVGVSVAIVRQELSACAIMNHWVGYGVYDEKELVKMETNRAREAEHTLHAEEEERRRKKTCWWEVDVLKRWPEVVVFTRHSVDFSGDVQFLRFEGRESINFMYLCV